VEDELDDNGDIHEEFAEDDVFVGQCYDRPMPSFWVDHEVQKDFFVTLQPADGDTKPIRIARAVFDPFTNPEHPNCILIQYFRPTARRRNVQECYIG